MPTGRRGGARSPDRGTGDSEHRRLERARARARGSDLSLRLLGSGGFVPTDRRETACALLRKDEDALLIDAGTGASRLLNEPELLDGVRRLDVVLTHFHLDHLIGLFYIADLEQPPDVWGAGEALEGIATAKLVDRLLDSPLAPPSFRDRLAVHELEIGGTEIGAFSVRTRIQHLHVNSTLALRIDDAIVWCTDTAYDPESADFIRGARVLCHEAFYAAEHTDDSGHTAAGEAARLAAASEVERLVLIHIHPDMDDDEALLSFARPHFAETVVGMDGLEVD